MPCKMCLERGKTWSGSDPTCAFNAGEFNTDNWNCATMNRLREIATGYLFPPPSGSFFARDDSDNASIGVLPLGCGLDEDDWLQGYLVMTWYKDRGRTGQAWIMNDDDPPMCLTLGMAEAILTIYNAWGPEDAS